MLPSYSYGYVYLLYDFSGCKFDVLAQVVRAPRRKSEGVSGSSPLCIALMEVIQQIILNQFRVLTIFDF